LLKYTFLRFWKLVKTQTYFQNRSSSCIQKYIEVGKEKEFKNRIPVNVELLI